MHYFTEENIDSYREHLRKEEYGEDTIKKYLRDIRAFTAWAGKQRKAEEKTTASRKATMERESSADREKATSGETTGVGEGTMGSRETMDRRTPVDKETTVGWKSHLTGEGYAPVTVNSMLSALNGFLRFMGWEESRVKFLKVQRCLFRDKGRELSRQEYERLIDAAVRQGDNRLALLIETICSTGIRVSEVRYITMEAVKNRRAVVSLKGKIRTILLTGKLCKKLRDYARKEGIGSGKIFLAENGKGIDRRRIWREMKKLCGKAGVEKRKVFPHNLRHLFARTFYKVSKDIVELADILGHSSIETTRIYLISTGEGHARRMERLQLIR